MKLRWEEQYPGSWYAYSSELIVGMVVTREDDTVVYNLDAVHTKWIAKGYGEVRSIRAGKRALERAWRKWLEKAGLI